MDFLKLTDDHLSVDEILNLVSSEKCGAVSMFVGTTRDNFEGREVKNLEYEAYEPMAYKVMKNICSTIRSKWEDVHHIAIYHRLSTVPVKEASVVIAISSPHRKDSILAVQYCIENLKALKSFENIIDNASDVNQTFDPHLIQVNATHAEMKSRIQKYTDRKRDQINMNNIKDFINNKNPNEDPSNSDPTSCARVDAVFVKLKDSKGHLKVLRTNNEWGPQTKMSYDRKLITMKDSTENSGPMSAVEERLSTAEQNLNIAKPVSSDIYSRLKAIEDKIMELESISPEYFMFWSSKNNDSQTEEDIPDFKNIKYSSKEIWQRMKGLEE